MDPDREDGGSCFLRGLEEKMAAPLWEKEAGEKEEEEERDSLPQTPASSPRPWSVTEPSCLPPTNSFLETSGFRSQVPPKLPFLPLLLICARSASPH